MEKRILSIVLAASLVWMSSCSSSYSTALTRTTEPAEKPLMADLEVGSKKVTATYTETKSEIGKRLWMRNISNSGRNEQRMKELAVYKALEESNADVLVSPSYKMTTKIINSSNQSVTVVVSGYPGKYTNFRPVPEITGFEVQELKGEPPYIIINKDNEGKSVTYQVVSDFRNNTLDFDLDGASVDKVVIGKGSLKKRNER